MLATSFSKKHQKGHVTSRSTRGFTLVELLVSVGLFTVVATIVSGTVITILDANARAQRISTAINNVSFAIDSMTRDIRTGYAFYCNDDPGNIPNSTRDCAAGDFFAYNDGRTNQRIAYRLQNSAIEVHNGSSWSPLTADDIKIVRLSFNVTDSDDGDTDDQLQPRIQILIDGYVEEYPGQPSRSDFKIQTRVTQRALDI